jgi:glutamate synthase domain-containing protein 2
MKYVRYSAFGASFALTVLVFSTTFHFHHSVCWALIPLAFFILGVYDKIQTKHSILRNYPILGHMRYLIEYIRPEMRQYIVESDTEEVPFSRAQRAVVYQRSKKQVDSQAFGTKIDVMRPAHEWMIHSMKPSTITSSDFRITVGPNCKQPYSMSVFNISAMSFGALSANAIRALNLGAKMGNFAHDTGEGSVSKYHLENGGDLIYQVASGYFGCRNDDGTFSAEKFKVTASNPQIKMIEIKLSQGAKPGHGGVLPAAKITPEISETRGVPMGVDCISPSSHSSFSNPSEFLQFAQRLKDLSGGKPVGMKFCVGQPWEFFGICKAMMQLNIYLDFIVVDGAEGGTGAAPLEFTDHIGTPLQEGLLLVHNTLVGLGIRDKIKIGAAGKIITAFDMARIFALGADWINSARGFLFSLGCIQALSCNTGNCPTGITTQDPERQKALVVPEKAERVYNFHHSSLHALQELLQATGVEHPSELKPHHIMKRISAQEVALLADTLPFLQKGDLLNRNYRYAVFEKYWEKSQTDSFNMIH